MRVLLQRLKAKIKGGRNARKLRTSPLLLRPVGAERVGVRWGLKRSFYDLEHASDILEHVVVPNAEHAIATLRKLRGAAGIRLDLIGMLSAIELSH
jgi:hypothetical protein